MERSHYNETLCRYLDGAPSPFHAVARSIECLHDAGFTALDERDPWALTRGGRYYVTRNGSSLIAFVIGQHPAAERGLCMVGAHTDSPCLKLKPSPEIRSQGYWQVGVEVYGGVLLNPWFDRDLGLAGRLSLRLPEGRLENRLLDLRRPVAYLPSLAIHLDREANEKRSINKQTHLPCLLAMGDGDFNLRQALVAHLAEFEPAIAGAELLDFELSLYDLNPAALVGWHGEFIASARLDNLLSCHAATLALAQATGEENRLIVLNDHEEVGSTSTAGARGTFLKSVLERICGPGESMARAMAQSILVSTDNAHGIHPNFPDRHDGNHGPKLNAGPVLKVNHNQSYATNSETAAWLRDRAVRAGVALQTFVSRGDMGCGSTIGPLTAAQLGVRTVDVGVPTFGMHSIRELAGRDDAHALQRLLLACFAQPTAF